MAAAGKPCIFLRGLQPNRLSVLTDFNYTWLCRSRPENISLYIVPHNQTTSVLWLFESKSKMPGITGNFLQPTVDLCEIPIFSKIVNEFVQNFDDYNVLIVLDVVNLSNKK